MLAIYTPTHAFRRQALWSVRDAGLLADTPRQERRIADAIDVLKSGDLRITGPAIGAPCAALIVEDLSARGVTQLVFIGSAGGIVLGGKNPEIGDFVIPAAALIDEGTSPRYGLEQCADLRPSPLQTEIEAELQKYRESSQLLKGTVWSTDAPYCETPDRVSHFEEQGAIAVEMEVSALATVCRAKGIELAVVLVISDLVGDKSVRGFRSAAFRHSLRIGCDAAARTICRCGAITAQSGLRECDEISV